MAQQRVLIPRSLMALFCTVLQVCFGTVYAWSFFQTLLVRQLGWTFTETAWAFSLTILSLGTSAAWAGALLPRVGPRRLAVTGSVMFSGRLYAGESGAKVGHARAVLRGVRRHWRRGHRTGLRHARGDGSQVVPGQKGLGDRNRRNGVRGGCLSVEQGLGTPTRIPPSRRSVPSLPGPRGDLRLCPDPLQLALEQSPRCCR